MRLVTQTLTGGPEVLSLVEAPVPLPGPGEVLVAVAAAGINPVDIGVRSGAFPILGAPPFSLGWDIAGTVAAVGAGVADLAPGDRVFGMPRFPGEAAAYAEFVTAPAAEIARIPGGMSDAEAGALPLAGLTAWQALVRTADVGPGRRVLVTAAAGGVGHLAVQIAKARGAEVIASTSAGKRAFVAGLGADRVLDRRTEDFAAFGPYDAILDALGGEQAEAALDALAPGGIVVSLLDPSAAARAKARAEGKRLERILCRPDRAGLEALAALHVAGRLRVAVARTFPLAEAGAAQAFLGTAPIGKVILAPGR